MLDPDLSFRVAELERQMVSVVRHGIIADVDYEIARARVDIGEHITGWLPWFTVRASGQEVSWNAPEIGERVSVLSPRGDLELGRIVPAIYSTDSPAPSINPDISTTAHKDGGHVTYDRVSHTYTIQPNSEGVIQLIVGGNKITIDDTDIKLDAAGDVTVTAQSVTVAADAVNLGGTGGAKVARVGDAIDTITKKIIGGSDVTKSI